MTIHWDDDPIAARASPGPSAGSTWAILPEEKVVFVGDAVLRNQPPFLAGADLPAWLDTLKLLLSPAYRGWLVVSGRGGLVKADVIRAQKDYLDQVLNKIEKLAQKKAAPEAVENLVAPLLGLMKDPGQPPAKIHPAPALRSVSLLRPALSSGQQCRRGIDRPVSR